MLYTQHEITTDCREASCAEVESDKAGGEIDVGFIMVQQSIWSGDGSIVLLLQCDPPRDGRVLLRLAYSK